MFNDIEFNNKSIIEKCIHLKVIKYNGILEGVSGKNYSCIHN